MSEQRDNIQGALAGITPLLEEMEAGEWTAENGTSYRFIKRPGQQNYRLSRKIVHRAQIIKALSQEFGNITSLAADGNSEEENNVERADFLLNAVQTVTELFDEKFVDELEKELLKCVMYKRGGTTDAYNLLTPTVMDHALEGADFTDMYIILARSFVVNFIGGLRKIGSVVDYL